MKKTVLLTFIATILLASVQSVSAKKTDDQSLSCQEKSVAWIQPNAENQYQLLWGFEDGIRIGLVPQVIRGLITIHAPYVGQQPHVVTNFIAVEPIPATQVHRGFSELEQSELDQKRGKRIWSSNNDQALEPGDEKVGASGVVGIENGVETLSVFFFYEPFQNGAKVYVKATFYADKPYEVEISTFKRDDSAELDYCIATATMGNYARLRNLYLKDDIKCSLDVWPDYKGTDFTPHYVVSKDQMIRGKNGGSYFIASPNEPNPQEAEYAERTAQHWKYTGKPATQYWYCKEADDSLKGLVNGRFTYWASDRPIPGGISFENFEMNKKFRQGDRFVFGINPSDANSLIINIQK